MAQACVRTSQECAQFACATEQISDPINTIRTQACQSNQISSYVLEGTLHDCWPVLGTGELSKPPVGSVFHTSRDLEFVGGWGRIEVI